MTIKNGTICITVILLSLSFLMISTAGQEKTEKLARINGRNLTYGEFERILGWRNSLKKRIAHLKAEADIEINHELLINNPGKS